MAGSVQHLVELRETTQGKTPNKNLNISAAMEAFLQDEGFRNFLEAQHGDYMKMVGGTTSDFREEMPSQASVAAIALSMRSAAVARPNE